MLKMKAGWKEVSVEEISDKIQYGLTSRSGSSFKGAKYLRITDIQNRTVEWEKVPYSEKIEDLDKYYLNEGDVIFARTGATVGKSYLIKTIPERTVFASYLIRVVVDKTKIIPDFLSYYFQSPMYWNSISIEQRGIGQPNVNGKLLGKLRFSMPCDIDAQRKVVDAIETQLTRLDASIKSLRAIKNKFEFYRQSILKSAFEGKLVECAEFERRKISDYCSKVRKINPQEENFGEFYYIDISSVDNVRKKITTPKIVSSDFAPSRARQETILGDIVYSTVRVYLKNMAIIENLKGKKIISSTGFTVLRPNEKLNNKYLFYYLQTNKLIRLLNEKQRGTSYPAIRDNDVFETIIRVPRRDTQDKIVDEIESRFSVIDKVGEVVNNALGKAERLRRSILKTAFEGKLVR